MNTQHKPKIYKSIIDLYKDQNDTFKASMRQFFKDLGYKGGSIDRKIKEPDDTRPVIELDSLHEVFGICREPKKGYFFEPVDANNEIYGLN